MIEASDAMMAAVAITTIDDMMIDATIVAGIAVTETTDTSKGIFFC